MNDPHVVALVYRINHSESVNYNNAKTLEYGTAEFKVRVANREARFEMKEHYATEEAARAVVEPFIRAWEVAAAIDGRPGEFELDFANAEIIDRNPPPGVVIHVSTARMKITGYPPTIVVGRSCYPAPPTGIAVNADVEAMIGRYARSRDGKDTLPGMAYFCLTVIEESAGGRPAAAKKFMVEKDVLSTLGHLTGEKGGADARKGKGRASEFTTAERRWIDEALKKLIRRAAEVAYDPAASLARITMADLPTLT